MRTSRHNTRHQHGFIQGAILFALALIVVIIAAFAAANNDTTSNADIERDRANAAVVVAASVNLKTAVDRALADGNLLTNLQPQAAPVAASGSAATPVGLFNPTLGYASAPTIPPAAIVTGKVAAFSIASVVVTGLGSAAAETVIQIDNLTASVCQRAAAIANGLPFNPATPATAPIAGGTMTGCYDSGSVGSPVFSFYRVLATG